MAKISAGNCTICDRLKNVRYIDLYVIGSEGTRLCHECEMLVVEFIREKKRSNAGSTLREHLQKKESNNG